MRLGMVARQKRGMDIHQMQNQSRGVAREVVNTPRAAWGD